MLWPQYTQAIACNYLTVKPYTVFFFFMFPKVLLKELPLSNTSLYWARAFNCSVSMSNRLIIIYLRIILFCSFGLINKVECFAMLHIFQFGCLIKRPLLKDFANIKIVLYNYIIKHNRCATLSLYRLS